MLFRQVGVAGWPSHFERGVAGGNHSVHHETRCQLRRHGMTRARPRVLSVAMAEACQLEIGFEFSRIGCAGQAVDGTYDVLNSSFSALQIPTRAHQESHGSGAQRCPWSHVDPDLTSVGGSSSLRVGLARQIVLVFFVFGTRADFFCLFCTSQTCVVQFLSNPQPLKRQWPSMFLNVVLFAALRRTTTSLVPHVDVDPRATRC